MKTLHLKNVIYFPSFNSVGGVETFCYEMGLKYGKDFDITVLYRNGDKDMLAHIAEVCRVVKYHPGDRIVCDVFIFGYGWEQDMFDNLEAKEIIQTFHADYVCRHLNPCNNGRITKRFGVADNTTNGIRDHYPWAKDIVTMYNPYTVKKPKKVLNLISATRLTAEKGYDRMVKFADALDKAGIPFQWTVFTCNPVKFPNKSVCVMPHRLDILDFIANADYLVQLSDTEGYSYSIVEALSVGTPVICTEFPVAGEQGVINGKTGFILPFDMSEIPVDAIYKGVKKFICVPRETHYDEVLSPGECDYDEVMKADVRVRATRSYNDLELGRIVYVGEEFVTSYERADHLEDIKFAKIVGEVGENSSSD